MNNLSVDEHLSALEKKIDALASLIDQQTQRVPKSVNHSGGQGSSIYNYKEQVQQLSDNKWINALMEEDIRECNFVFQNVKEGIQEPTLVEENSHKLLMRKSYQLRIEKRESTIH